MVQVGLRMVEIPNLMEFYEDYAHVFRCSPSLWRTPQSNLLPPPRILITLRSIRSFLRSSTQP